MRMQQLSGAIEAHTGEFHCEQINKPASTKVVTFHHLTERSALDVHQLPDIGSLRDFYSAFDDVLFYFDEVSGASAKHIVSPACWDELKADFTDWLHTLDEADREKLLPTWIDNCLVVGETPQSGNYVLMPTTGEESGQIFEFDHDGFEFIPAAKNLIEYVEHLLAPDGNQLTEFAAHMRFIEPDSVAQWWVLEMRDNQGRVVKTRE
ncbi:MAG TPA: hypothetical protein PK586_07950 [Casimicrobium sp.]|nr:hypothetical protein [Casimicrobium sp.]